MITFNGIPVGIRTPGQYIEFDNSRAMRGLPAIANKILLIGQRLPTGTVPALVPTRMLSVAQAEEAFGRGSMLAGIVAASKAANSYTDTYAIAVDDVAAGTQAEGKFVFGGPSTAAGTLALYVGGVRVQVGVVAGMTADQLATDAAAAINAMTNLPVTAAAANAECTVTARHKGLAGNSIDLRMNYAFGEVTPAGVTVAITPMAGGATNPDLGGVIAAMGAQHYNTIVVPYTDAANLTAIETELARRWGPMVQQEGQAFAGVSGSVATMTTLGDSRNSQHLSIVGAGKSPTLPWIYATVMAAVDAFEPDPARPRQTLVLPGCLAPSEVDRPTREERNTLLHEGISTVVVDDGGTVRIERLITTWQTNANGDPDTSYLDIETMRTLAYLRTSLRERIASKFPRSKLADDNTAFGPGQDVATPLLIKCEILHLFREWESAGLVENFDQFKSQIDVQRNAGDPNRVDALIPPDLINQFRVFAAQIQFLL